MEDAMERNGLEGMMRRTSLCVAGPTPGVVAHDGDEGYRETVQQHYSVAENNVVEQLVQLKAKLSEATTHDFWSLLMEGMTSITGAQYGFVTKRILVDDHDSAVEMPRIGEPGSCLLGVAFYYNDGNELKHLHRDYRYLAYGAPCHHMKHDKVFLIPSDLNTFITNNPNEFPFPTEAYLGVPLFAEGKCFAHFGLMWTTQGLKRLELGWAYVEMILHSLEDIVLQRLVEGQSFAKGVDNCNLSKVIPKEQVSAAQSLKPFARSLSHELRTPMQGVVGMLDVMHATVQESLEAQSDSVVSKVLKSLQENIEVVQDSSRRAVEAADNVVRAYDLDMQVPDTPVGTNEDVIMDLQSTTSADGRRPSLLGEGNSFFSNHNKRQRTGSTEWDPAPPAKHRVVHSTNPSPHRHVSPNTASVRNAVEESDSITHGVHEGLEPVRKGKVSRRQSTAMIDSEALEAYEPEAVVTPGLRYTKVRDLLRLIVNESLRVGGRPDSAIAEDTDGGEIIEVRTRNANGGESSSKIIDWSVDPLVPETIFGISPPNTRKPSLTDPQIQVDERDLAKLVSCVFLNAVKFTECGKISLRAALSNSSRRYIVINVVDTGPGIPPAFMPNLFKAFSREDDSLTRQKEGLGLGLLVAKGLARSIGGELLCVRSDIAGPRRGSEFEMRVPISMFDAVNSRTSTPGIVATPSRFLAEEPAILNTGGQQPSSANQRTGPLDNESRATSPRMQSSPSNWNSPSQNLSSVNRRASTRSKVPTFNRHLAKKHPLTFLVVEDNKLNRKLLVNMLHKFGYTDVYEAFDGLEAVRQMSIDRVARNEKPIDVVLMDIWMPNLDGYQATERILAMDREKRRESGILDEKDDDRARRKPGVTILAISADATPSALERANEVGMAGFLNKPYKLLDLERLIIEYCSGD